MTKGKAAASQAFAAIDLGTNNCRLLVATPRRTGFRVIDGFSRIVRLGEGVSKTGALSQEAMDRTIDALKVCAEKMAQRQVTASRCIATQACRSAHNGELFLERVKDETGLALDLITEEEEASLSVRGCEDLIDPEAKAVLVFDIGGGSTELSWVIVEASDQPGTASHRTAAWTSLPVGVVSMAEKHGDVEISRDAFDVLTEEVAAAIHATPVPDEVAARFRGGPAHLIGTSGTVTSLAGVFLGLQKYSRQAVDGLWLTAKDAHAVSEKLRAASFDQRAADPCIGHDRADLVVPGCAILSGVLKAWPADRIRVGDRGLREGLLMELIDAWRAGGRAGGQAGARAGA